MDTDHHNLYVAKSTNSYTLPEIPTSGDLKSGDSISCTNPLPKCPQNPPPPHPTNLLNCQGNGLEHYMNSYMKYIPSKFAFIIVMTK